METIYRFYGNRDFDLDSLANHYLWFSQLDSFNDPFEGMYIEAFKYNRSFEGISTSDKIKLLKSLDFGEHDMIQVEQILLQHAQLGHIDHLMQKFLDETFETLKNHFENFKRDNYACCFAKHKLNKPTPLASKLMWSHYCDGLRGFAIEFDTELLINSLETLSGQDVGIGEIDYRELKSYDFYKDFASRLDKDPHSGFVQFGNTLNKKSPEWEYEQELRLYLKNGNVHHFEPNAVKRIIIGGKMSEVKQKTLLSIVKQVFPEVVIADAVINMDTFQIDIIDRV